MSEQKFWSNEYFLRPTLSETMLAVAGTDYAGQSSFEDFSYAEGLDVAIITNLEEVVREVFGSRFKEIRTWHGMRVHVSRTRRAHIDKRKVDLGIDFFVNYHGLFDFLDDHDEFQRVFHGIIGEMRTRIKKQYPLVSVGMTHRYHSKKSLSLQLNVTCEPTMLYNRKAA